MNRLPLRWRLTLAFAAALAVLLTAVGVFLYARLGAELDRLMRRDLSARSEQLGGLLLSSPIESLPREPAAELEPDETVAQILRADGTVVAASAHADVALLTPDQLEAALRGPVLVDRPGDRVLDERLRILARPVTARGQTYAVLVSASLDERGEALRALLRTEILGLGGALLLSSLVGYGAAGLLLRPLEHGERLQRELLARQRRFLADASHQLRTPLAIIKTEVELAHAPGTANPELRAALASTGEEVDRLSALTDQLLALAAADEQRLDLAPVDLRLDEVLTASAQRTARRAALERRTISVRTDGSTLRADPRRLGDALDNLLDNALRHGAGPIEMSGHRSGSVVTVEVRDHGEGFPPGYLSQPFERFVRGAGARGGTGLGLPIVQAIVEAHAGRVSLHNDGGAIVTLELPA